MWYHYLYTDPDTGETQMVAFPYATDDPGYEFQKEDSTVSMGYATPTGADAPAPAPKPVRPPYYTPPEVTPDPIPEPIGGIPGWVDPGTSGVSGAMPGPGQGAWTEVPVPPDVPYTPPVVTPDVTDYSTDDPYQSQSPASGGPVTVDPSVSGLYGEPGVVPGGLPPSPSYDDDFMSTWVPGGTETMDPYEQYKRMVYGQLPSMPYGTRASQALERAAMSRFAPSLGQFLLSAYPSGLPGTEEEAIQAPTFTEWAQRQPATAATGARMPFAGAAGTTAYDTFQNIANLSGMYGTDPTPAQQAEMAGSPYGGFLTGDPQSYITQYALGGPQRGYLGRLMGNRAGRLQDLFEKQRMTQGSDIYGAPEEQYFDWLRNVLPAQYGIGATGP
jgi:hypothetical protein